MAFHKKKKERKKETSSNSMSVSITDEYNKKKRERVRMNKCRHHVVICGWSQGHHHFFCNELVLAQFNIDHHLT